MLSRQRYKQMSIFLPVEQECILKSKCSFQEKIDSKTDNGYIRKER